MGNLVKGLVLGLVGAILAMVMVMQVMKGQVYPLIQKSFYREAPEVKVRKEGFFSFRSVEIENLVTNLTQEKLNLMKRRGELDGLAKQAEAQKKEVEQIREELDKMMKGISEKIVMMTKAEKKNLQDLAATYSNLSPEAVVEVFKEMDDIVVVKILSNMDPGIVAQVFQNMMKNTTNNDASVKRVARLSELLRRRVEEK